jgi:hypothetical protein
MLQVREPSTSTEFEVQAYLWNELRRLGINVRGEVKTKFDKRCYVRFDLAIFENGQLKEIIEIKRSKMNHKTSWVQTRQGRRYSSYGVPVSIVYGLDDADVYLKNKQS